MPVDRPSLQENLRLSQFHELESPYHACTPQTGGMDFPAYVRLSKLWDALTRQASAA